MTTPSSDAKRWEQLPRAKLARMLDVASPENGWSAAEAGTILHHQLFAPLLPDLLLVPGTEEKRLHHLVKDRPGAKSFGEQLTFLFPSLELLEAIKHFARYVRDDAANPLRGNPADVLYFSAIAAALLRCDARISKLSDAELREGFAWVAQQPGAEMLQLVLRDAAAKLST